MRSATVWSIESGRLGSAACDRSSRSILLMPAIYTGGIALLSDSFPGKYALNPRLYSKSELEYSGPARIVVREVSSPRRPAAVKRGAPPAIREKEKPDPPIPSIPSAAFARSRGEYVPPPAAASPCVQSPSDSGNPEAPRFESPPGQSSILPGHGPPRLEDRWFEKAARGRSL